MKTAFLFSDEFALFDYGASHPLKPYRLKLVSDLIQAFGLLDAVGARLVKAVPAKEKDLLLFHDREYLDILSALNKGSYVSGAGHYGIGFGDNPVFKGMYDWSRIVTGASLQAAELVDCGEADIAFNISGGLHHALACRASGFCYINDPVIAIMSLLKKGRRVMYVDIDAHHGDGVQAAFYETDKVLTVSIHESGYYLFPGSGFEHETGKGRGEGYSVNVPLPPYADDELFLYAFNEIVPPLFDSFKPDILVSQLGVDTFRTDPLTHLRYTSNGFCDAVRTMKALAPGWVALGGGGYHMANVARAWTLAWAIMCGREVPDSIPEEFLEAHRHEGFGNGRLRDKAFIEKGEQKELMRREVERVVVFLKAMVFPKIR
ncbi:MAG: acetoin utilization protein AcuC [Nitrospirota bacterium]|nr:acetoin utilization protein AcuC [Nitrospirota bacterium]